MYLKLVCSILFSCTETSGTWGIKTALTVNLQLVLLELRRPEQMGQKGQEAKVSALIDMAHMIKLPFQQNGASQIFCCFLGNSDWPRKDSNAKFAKRKSGFTKSLKLNKWAGGRGTIQNDYEPIWIKLHRGLGLGLWFYAKAKLLTWILSSVSLKNAAIIIVIVYYSAIYTVHI